MEEAPGRCVASGRSAPQACAPGLRLGILRVLGAVCIAVSCLAPEMPPPPPPLQPRTPRSPPPPLLFLSLRLLRRTRPSPRRASAAAGDQAVNGRVLHRGVVPAARSRRRCSTFVWTSPCARASPLDVLDLSRPSLSSTDLILGSNGLRPARPPPAPAAASDGRLALEPLLDPRSYKPPGDARSPSPPPPEPPPPPPRHARCAQQAARGPPAPARLGVSRPPRLAPLSRPRRSGAGAAAVRSRRGGALRPVAALEEHRPTASGLPPWVLAP